MFIRVKKNSGTLRRSVIACHNIRNGDKIQQSTARIFGHSACNKEIELLKAKAKQWVKNNSAIWQQQNSPVQKRTTMKRRISISNLREESRINVGIEDIFGKLYNELGFHNILSSPHQKTLRNVLFARILDPGSKRRASHVAEKNLADKLPLDRIYRMMDALIKKDKEVAQKVFDGTRKALNEKISLMLFDVTTLSFETIREDELRAFGFSKDFKFNTTQVVLALATTQEGLPIGFQLFPGNTAETKTLIESINNWRQYLPIEDVTIVGDRAMMSEDNLSQLEAAGFGYIVAFPLRKLPKKQKEIILDRSNYHKDKSVLKQEIDGCCNIELNNERHLYVSYSEQRAEKDLRDRERMIKKLQKKLSGKSKKAKALINNNGYLRYAEIDGEITASINEERIAEDMRWDGLHGVISNKLFKDTEAHSKYKRLWVIEESFRINKHNLKMRPIYHFTPRRIQAHILLCYMEFALMKHIQLKLRQIGEEMSVDRIVSAVKDVQASILVDVTNDSKYRVPSALSEDAKIIYKSLGLENKLTTTTVL